MRKIIFCTAFLYYVKTVNLKISRRFLPSLWRNEGSRRNSKSLLLLFIKFLLNLGGWGCKMASGWDYFFGSIFWNFLADERSQKADKNSLFFYEFPMKSSSRYAEVSSSGEAERRDHSLEIFEQLHNARVLQLHNHDVIRYYGNKLTN